MMTESSREALQDFCDAAIDEYKNDVVIPAINKAESHIISLSPGSMTHDEYEIMCNVISSCFSQLRKDIDA